ncbi:MAG: orotate phosphoribosyltransferase [Methyloceanibacter sp.]
MDLKRQRLDLRTKLFNLLKEKSFRREKVVLASGKESDFYFDMKPAMLDPEGAGLMAELILHELQGVKADCIGGLVMGAVPLVSPVAMKSHKFGRSLVGFFIRKEAKDHGTKKLVEGDSIEGKKVVILDDVTTSGGSAMEAVRAAREAGATVTLVLSIVDRGEGAAELYASEGLDFYCLFRAEEFLAAGR